MYGANEDCMHLIDIKTLKVFWKIHPDSETWLRKWYHTAEKSTWKNVAEVRDVFPHADLAKVASGNTVTIFNVCGNKYRLITAIHFNTKRIYLLVVLTHDEYDTNKWKAFL
jgi:mRNA interferase HigB